MFVLLYWLLQKSYHIVLSYKKRPSVSSFVITNGRLKLLNYKIINVE